MMERMKTVAFYTLGCKVNQYDTEAMKESFLSAGYEVVDFESVADVYVINTCTVTARGDSKSRQATRHAARLNKDAVIAVTGCYSQVDPEAVSAIPEVDVVAGTNQGGHIVELVEKAAGERVISTGRETGWPAIAQFEGRTRAVLKIQEGCEQFCAYCIVPRARGKLRSREPQDVVSQVERLVQTGFKEIVLTGVHLGAYGKETERFNLASLLRDLAGVQGLPRLRLSSIEPIDISSEVFDSLSALPAFCEHLHISLQSGCGETLRRMNRPYSPEDFLRIIERARELFPEIGISTDVIVGFPGETDAQFAESMEFVQNAHFSRLHVFKYSARPGTAAALLPGRIQPATMAGRSSQMIEVGSRLAAEFHQSFVGKRLEVLVEEPGPDGRLSGFSRNYIRAEFSGGPELENEIVDVVVRTAGPHGVFSSLG